MQFNGLGVGLHNIATLSNAKSRSISAENFTGEKGKAGMATEGTGKECARELGVGWKISPSVVIKAKTVFEMANINESGCINHIWMTTHFKNWRTVIVKMFWDDEENPSVLVPIGDLFCNGWCERVNINSLPISVNPAGGFNIYFPMPFRKCARIEIENLSNEDIVLYYQVDYILTEVPDDAAYFHAQWRRNNPLKYMDVHTILDDIKGKGHYVGTYLAWQVNSNNWWGEGEIKFYMDGDKEFPTICGTGTEDYFGGAWDFEQPTGEYCTFSAPYLGFPQHIKSNHLYQCNQRFGMYRFHILDPIRFEDDLKVTIQALGWRSKGRYLPLQDDIASVGYWYQIEPHTQHKPLDDVNFLEVI